MFENQKKRENMEVK